MESKSRILQKNSSYVNAKKPNMNQKVSNINAKEPNIQLCSKNFKN